MLPHVLRDLILPWLDISTLMNLRQTCQEMCSTIQNSVLQTVDSSMLFVRSTCEKEAQAFRSGFLTMDSWRCSCGQSNALATAMKDAFVPCLNETARHLTGALKCVHEDVLIRHAMSTVSDLCFALEGALSTEFCDTMMAAMLEFMQNAEAPMHTKILALTGMGDIALQIGARFEKYFSAIFPVIESAGAYVKVVDGDNADMLDLREELVESVCECFTGFIQGSSSQRDMLAPYVMHMTEFIGYFGSIEDIGDRSRDLCVQVLGDVLNVFKDYHRGDLLRAIHAFINDPRIGEIIRKAKHCSTESYRNSAQWTQEQIVLFLKSYMSNMGGHH